MCMQRRRDAELGLGTVRLWWDGDDMLPHSLRQLSLEMDHVLQLGKLGPLLASQTGCTGRASDQLACLCHHAVVYARTISATPVPCPSFVVITKGEYPYSSPVAQALPTSPAS